MNKVLQKKYNDGSFYSKVYYSSYNNLNGEPHQESYQSQTIKQTNNGHNISETKEAYKNSNGVVKSAYQRNLDDKTTRFIKEKNLKTGKHNQKKVIKGIEERKKEEEEKIKEEQRKKEEEERIKEEQRKKEEEKNNEEQRIKEEEQKKK